MRGDKQAAPAGEREPSGETHVEMTVELLLNACATKAASMPRGTFYEYVDAFRPLFAAQSVQPAPGADKPLLTAIADLEALREKISGTMSHQPPIRTQIRTELERIISALRSASPVWALPENVDLLLVGMAQHIHIHSREPNKHKGDWNTCQFQPCKDVAAVRAGASPVAPPREVNDGTTK